MFFCEIAIDVPLRTTFTYAFETRVLPGQRVLVPFGRQKRVGFVLGCSTSMPSFGDGPEKRFSKDKLKSILEVLDTKPLVPKEYLAWLLQAADYYFAPVGQVLAQAIPPFFWQVDATERSRTRKSKAPKLSGWQVRTDITLTDEQNEVVSTILKNRDRFFPALLQGVTGSGKTEVYIEVIRSVLQNQKSALYLVPEIGLTPQTLGRLHAHFPEQILVYHSSLTQNQRHLQWQACQSEKPQILVGTRSAVFAPFENLGVIVVDEEHDSSYKQEDRFRYHARDLAVLRAKNLSVPVVMGSATPSLESYHLATQKKYHHFSLAKRVSGAGLPQMDLLDVGRERLQTGSVLHLSKHIHRKISQSLEKQQQMIVFVGSRGFAQNAFCTACRKVEQCPNCSVGLKHHARQNHLKCHYCDFVKTFDDVCQSCGAKSVTLLGTGIQAVENELREQHPRLRLQRVDSDTITSQKKLAELFSKFQKHEFDLILGTQMMTKGHDFAKVAFVGVAGVESQLGLPDFRATERAFQTIVQVAGRAGRERERGLVLVQSFMPEHESLGFAVRHDYKAFAETELTLRQNLFYPPFSRLVQIRLVAASEERLKTFLRKTQNDWQGLRQTFLAKQILLLGPTEMPIYKLRGLFRHHVILKMPKTSKTALVLDYILTKIRPQDHTGIDCQIDVDPQAMM